MANTHTHSNLRNAAVAILAPLPSVLFYLAFLRQCAAVEAPDSLSPLWKWCYHHPLKLAHVFFFFNVNVLFWVVGTLQSSHWMIDLYWTVIPVLLVHYWVAHPLAGFNYWRSVIVIVLTWVWSIRLTHSYFRRERWQWGAREDWRFYDMRKQYGKNWWWLSFFSVYASQQIFLMGICLPLYIVHSKDEPLTIWDLVAALVCLSGIVIAYFADTQLHYYILRNEEMRQLGEEIIPYLDEGLWQYSRHPNYFGEQLWWWGLAMFAWNLDYGWAMSFFGPFVNSLCLVYVTFLVEERMLKQQYRAEAYKKYRSTTSVWIPWFKCTAYAKDLKKRK